MTFITEKEYVVLYSPAKCTYELSEYYIATSIIEAIKMCNEQHEGCNIKEARFLHEVRRKSTKIITVEI